MTKKLQLVPPTIGKSTNHAANGVLRILTGKKHPKIMNMGIWVVGASN